MQSSQSQTVSYGAQDLADLNRLVTEFTSHLGELQIDARQRQRAEAQIATLKAQLTDEPDPVIIKQAGRTLRNITEDFHRKPACHRRPAADCLGLGPFYEIAQIDWVSQFLALRLHFYRVQKSTDISGA